MRDLTSVCQPWTPTRQQTPACQDLKLKEKRIQEELDEDGNFPFDLTDGRMLRQKLARANLDCIS